MRRIPALLLCFTFWIHAQETAAATPKTGAASEIDEAVAQLSKITGLPALRRVQQDTITRAGVRQFLEEKIKEEVKPEEIRLQELMLKRFGLLPREFDLKSATVDLITEQAAAFYDFRKKKLFFLEGDDVKIDGTGPEFGKAAQRMIVVHELAHALADQHFDLGKFIKKSQSDDASTARMAVMEGQATWLMLESMAANLGQSMREMPAMVDLMGASASEAMASQYPVLANAPLYLKTSLIFPYNQGLKFQHAVVQKLGNAGFSQVFKQPPASTQQILHPEKYFAKVEPVKVPLPEGPTGKGWHSVISGSVGEFDHAVLFEQYLSKQEAQELAPQWRGATLGLSEKKNTKDVAMMYASEWADAASARRVFEAYKKVLKGKWKSITTSTDTDTLFEGRGDDGPYRVRLDGNRVTSVEGGETPIRSAQVH